MDKVIDIACATDDGINFTREHFGSAKLYLRFMDILRKPNQYRIC